VGRRQVGDESLTCQRHVSDKFSAQNLSDTGRTPGNRQVSDKTDDLLDVMEFGLM